jgi:hypothetical protein
VRVSKRLIAFLGLGQTRYPQEGRASGYERIAYELAGVGRSKTVELVQGALDELLGPFDGVTLFATPKVQENWRGSLARTWRDVPLTPVPDGKAVAEHWAIFDAVVRALDDAPLDAEVVFDATHGYRVQPMIGIAALTFWFSERARRGQPAPTVRVTYGAFEAATGTGEEKVAPIWDLTTLVLVSRWNAALDALMRYGRADDVERLAGELGKPAQRKAHEEKDAVAKADASYLVNFGKAARSYADDLALGRLRDLMTGAKGGSAKRLADLLGQQQAASLVTRTPALRGAMEDLERDVRQIVTPSVLAPEAFPAWVHLAEVYGRLQRFAEQAMVLREGAVTQYGHLVSQVGPEPGTHGCKDARGLLENGLGALTKQLRDKAKKEELRTTSTPRLFDLVELADAVQQARNDIEHGGLNEHPASATALRDTLEKLRVRLGSPVAPVAIANLTNHAVSTWSRAQSDAARALGFGEPLDLDGGMPPVDPSATSVVVSDQARGLADSVVAMKAGAAVVQGEHTLSFALVAELQRRGVRCFAATTARVVSEEEPTVAGATIHGSEARFVAFREYPGLLVS